MNKSVRTAVVGVGHFGTRHAEKYALIRGCELVAVADIDGARAAAVAERLGVAATADHRELFGAVDAVSVTVPTGAHYQVAREFLEAGVHVLVEKPMTSRLETADRLIAIAEHRRLVLQVGHIERFSSAYFALEKLVTRPLYFESYRIAPFRPRGVDVDVVLDLMIHDIDLILALVDSPVASVDAVGAPVLSAQEDIASTRVKFANGCVASITASRVSAKTERMMRIFQPDSYLDADFVDGTLSLLQRGEGEMMPGVPSIKRTETRIEKADSLADEIASFLDSVASGSEPRVDGASGREALRTALMVADSLREHRRRLAGELGP